MPDASPPTIPVLFDTSFSRTSGWQGGESYASLMVGSASGVSKAYGKGQNLTWLAVLDRKNPKADAVFSAAAPDNTTPPPGLESYLIPDYLLFAATAAFITQVPQGKLFDLLNANGGGAKLRQMETLGTHFACGVNGTVAYLMVSVPGAGLPGIEYFAQRGSASTGGSDPTVSYLNSPYQLMVDLIPTASGLYTPVPPM